MSTVQISRQNVVVPTKVPPRVAASQTGRVHPQRTQITQIYQDASDDNAIEKRMSSPKLDPIDKTVMSLELLNQYNDLMGPEDSLAFKRLPPVKVSYHKTNKFMETPRGDTSSRIIRPHLTMKTYSPGHHIFTEGISRNSEMKSPTFALQKIGVPYSNLPDSISIFKEKDKFAFGVKRGEVDKSPYRLTPRPLVTGTAQMFTHLEKIRVPNVDHDADDFDTLREKDKVKRRHSYRSSMNLKSNVIKLEPLLGRDHGEPLTYAANLGPSTEPLAPTNSFMLLDKQEAPKHLEHKSDKKMERKLSVVSIGDSVGRDFFTKNKRETRQTYPMYDHRSRKHDQYRQDKFGHHVRAQARPQVPSSTFTYKVSTRGHTFVDESSADKFKPIRNNLRDRYGYPIHKQRGVGRYSDDSESTSGNNRSSDYHFQRYYSRSFHLPRSAGSTSTDMTHLPGNPPPSEISHIFSEEGAAPLMVNDLRSGMVTLHEERTMTASIMSLKGADDNAEKDRRQMKSVSDLHPPLEENKDDTNADIYIDKDVDTSRTNATYTTTDTDMQFQAVLNYIEESRAAERTNTLQTGNSSIKRDDESSVYKYIAEAEERIKDERLDELTEADLTLEQSESNQNIPETNADNEAMAKEVIFSGNKDIEGTNITVIPEETADIEDTNITAMPEETADQTENESKSEVNEEVRSSENKLEINTNEHSPDKGSTRTTLSGSKKYLTVPKLSLDNTCHSALPHIAERTSLSRKIQNLPVPENANSHLAHKNGSTDKIYVKDMKAPVPITRLRLFSDASTVSTNAPSLCIMDENGEINYSSTSEDKLKPDESIYMYTEKRVLNNANVPFIYPSMSEIKAKRQ